MEGYLYKRGRGKSLSFVKPWAYRCVVLNRDTATMSYYAEVGGKRSLRGQFSIANCAVEEISARDGGRDFCFEVTLRPVSISNKVAKEEILLLAAENRKSQILWMTHIASVGGSEIKWINPPIPSECPDSPPVSPIAPLAEHPSTPEVSPAPFIRSPSLHDIDEDDYIPPTHAPADNLYDSPPIILDPSPPKEEPILAEEEPIIMAYNGTHDSNGQSNDASPIVLTPAPAPSEPSASPVMPPSALSPIASPRTSRTAPSVPQPSHTSTADSMHVEVLSVMSIPQPLLLRLRLWHCFDIQSFTANPQELRRSMNGLCSQRDVDMYMSQLTLTLVSWEQMISSLRFVEQHDTANSTQVTLQLLVNRNGREYEVLAHYGEWMDAVAAKIHAGSIAHSDRSSAEYQSTLSTLQAMSGVVDGQIVRHLFETLGAVADYTMDQEEWQSRRVGMTNDSHRRMNADEEFQRADTDGDGKINREEWRKWMNEKEALVKDFNRERSILVKENKLLRKALDPSREKVYAELRHTDEHTDMLSRELENAKDHIQKLEIELDICKKHIRDSSSNSDSIEKYLTPKRLTASSTPQTAPKRPPSMVNKETQSPDKFEPTALTVETYQPSIPSTSSQYDRYESSSYHDYRAEELASPTHDFDVEEIGQKLGSPKKYSVPLSINESMSPLMHEVKPKIPIYAQRSTIQSVSNGFAEKSGDYRVDGDYLIDFDVGGPRIAEAPTVDLFRHSRRRFTSEDGDASRSQQSRGRSGYKEHPLRQALRAKSPGVAHRRDYGHTPLDYRSTILNSESVSPSSGLVSPRHKPLFSVRRTEESEQSRQSSKKLYLSSTHSQLAKVKLTTAPIGAVKSIGVWK